jgi:transcriptional regulator with XRE-family HTH domain
MAPVPIVTPNGDAIRRARKSKKLTAQGLGDLLGGRHPQTIWQIETGTRDRASRILIHQIAAALDVTVDELIIQDAA